VFGERLFAFGRFGPDACELPFFCPGIRYRRFPEVVRAHIDETQEMIGQNFRILIAIFVLCLATACATNPVTGKSDFIVVSETQELELGRQNYAPMQQAQGGAYDIDPELTRYVQQVGNKLAAVSDRPLPYEFVVLNNSVPNAWALPGGKIAINRGLMTELSSESELAAVLGHEIVHAAAKHSAQQMSRGALLEGVVLATAVMAGGSNYGDLAVGGAAIGAQLISSTYGRGAELESDKYGMIYMSRAGYSTIGAVTLQKTFVRLSEGQESDWLSGLFASHPPSQGRVDANIETAATLPASGFIGVDEYRQAMKKTLAVKPAYEEYDAGRAALAEHKPKEALVHSEEAIRLFPEEGHFHALRADIRHAGGNVAESLPDYDAAIRRRDDYFYYYLQRGLAQNELGNIEAAAADLERSIGYYPTGPAHFVLGEIEVQRGNLDAAMDHDRIVAKAGGEYGKAASEKLMTADLARNPGAYVRHRCIASSDGQLIVALLNQTPKAMHDIEFRVMYSRGSELLALHKSVQGPLLPNEVGNVATGVPLSRIYDCPVTIVSASFVDQD
jgi:predicted Zn-dependent protease